MREVIAKRNRILFIVTLISGIIAILSGIFWPVESMKWMGVFSIVFNAVLVIPFSLYIIFGLPCKLIERDGDKLVLRNLDTKKSSEVIVNIADIVDVDLMANPQKPTERLKDAIEIKVVSQGIEQSYHITSILKTKEVLKKLQALIVKE